ncbi:MAG: YIP1 family protein [Acidimicrobiia bacterium]|nr:YIP1 family protein [Acidimicrobiia bacterium]
MIEWFRNVIRAMLLDVDFYNRAEHDSSLDGQAAVVVAVATALSGVGSAIATEANVLVGAGVGMLAGLAGWLIWAAIALVVGTKVFGGSADFGEMRRVLGFALAPLAIGVIPWLGFVGAAWSLVAATIGIREGLDFDTKRAIGTVVVGWAAWLGLAVLVQWIADVTITPRLPF